MSETRDLVMFTGIIEGIGKIAEVSPAGPGKRVRIEMDEISLSVGDSVAVDGVCLTAEEVLSNGFVAYLSTETLKRTKFGRVLRPGYLVNIETPLTPDKFLSGHLVQGHVDAVGTLKRLTRRGEEAEMEIEFPRVWGKYLVEKGPVAVDGVSLTVVKLLPNRFTVALVAHTLKATAFGSRPPRSLLNLEFDLFAKYVEGFLRGSR
ncbi:MAG: riboflavin synthase [candidate division WOR-3 bacterium]